MSFRNPQAPTSTTVPSPTILLLSTRHSSLPATLTSLISIKIAERPPARRSGRASSNSSLILLTAQQHRTSQMSSTRRSLQVTGLHQPTTATSPGIPQRNTLTSAMGSKSRPTSSRRCQWSIIQMPPGSILWPQKHPASSNQGPRPLKTTIQI